MNAQALVITARDEARGSLILIETMPPRSLVNAVSYFFNC
jgi:hypothetical protein